MRRAALGAFALAALLAGAAAAVPALDAPRTLGNFVVYPDHEKPHLFYYGPGPLALATDADGRPGLRFLQLRYVGSALYGDEGRAGVASTLTLRLRMEAPHASALQQVRHTLRKLAGDVAVELRPLPITALDARVVYAAIGGEPQRLPGGHFEAEDAEAARSSANAFWRERTYTLSLDPATSQLLWQTLQQGELLMSVTYAFFARGVADGAEVAVSAQGVEPTAGGAEPAALAELRAALEAANPAAEEPGAGPALRTYLVKADTTAVRVDAARWPGLFERFDFDDEAPPGYAALRVYCYDFRDRLRPDLFYKKVEVEAEAVGGRRIPITTKFLSSQPDLYATSVRFPIAVRVDRPFRYRVLAARRDGTIETGSWQERADWGGILDVTSRPE